MHLQEVPLKGFLTLAKPTQNIKVIGSPPLQGFTQGSYHFNVPIKIFEGCIKIIFYFILY